MATISIYEPVVIDADSPDKRNYGPALISLAVLYFMMGLITCLNDTLVPFFKKGFQLSYTQSSLVQFYFFLTYGVMSVPAGKIVEKTGYKNGMVSGFLIAAFGALLFFPASYPIEETCTWISNIFVSAVPVGSKRHLLSIFPKLTQKLACVIANEVRHNSETPASQACSAASSVN